MKITKTETQIVGKIANATLHKKFGQVLILAIILTGTWWYSTYGEAINSQANLMNLQNQSGEKAVVTRVVDGDTFYYQINGELHEVRMLGIDTPETVDPRKEVQCFGKEASDQSKKLLNGQAIVLKKDSKESGNDKYGRELRYVYLNDGTFVNEYLVEQGYAHATPQYSFDLKDHFVDLENQARIANRGLWNTKVCPIK